MNQKQVKVIKLGTDARASLLKGANTVADAVRTLGHAGRNTIIGRNYRSPRSRMTA